MQLPHSAVQRLAAQIMLNCLYNAPTGARATAPVLPTLTEEKQHAFVAETQ